VSDVVAMDRTRHFQGREPVSGEEFPQELEGDAIKKLGELLLEYLREKNGSTS